MKRLIYILLLTPLLSFANGGNSELNDKAWQLVWSDEFDTNGAQDAEKLSLATEGDALEWGGTEDEPKSAPYPVEFSGEMRKWHKVTLTFDGPEVSERDDFNPFMNYRLNVTFTHKQSGKSYLVPGYFAADGDAGNTSATSGSKWRVHFAPDQEGDWDYSVNFRKGQYVAVSDRVDTYESGKYMDGASGSFHIDATNKSLPDNRAKGRLNYVGKSYLQFAETGEYFLKAGVDAPENMLSYADFDGTFHNDGHNDYLVKSWSAHLKHWNEGDPTWKDGKGKAIIGAVNYLASKGLNSFSFITMNINGDDKNVFPYVDYNTLDRMDCSKLDQWEVLFEHGDSLGMFLHFKLLEFENQGLLDNSGVGARTKLYFREMIARFGHHLAMNWNMCEETGDWDRYLPCAPQDDWNRLALAGYFEKHDPYKHHRVIHNGEEFAALAGPNSPYTGISLQTWNEKFIYVHDMVKKWLKVSKDAGKQWAVACDEPGDHRFALVPDDIDPTHNYPRQNALWGAMMAGAWGTEWYFGYEHAHSDLTCEDYSSRDLYWDQCKHALDFFRNNDIPYWEMENHDELVLKEKDYCLAKEGEIYIFYFKDGSAKVNLSQIKGRVTPMWYNPRKGGELQRGSKRSVKAGAEVDLGKAPCEESQDWVVVVRTK